MEFIKSGATLPVPLNVIPTPKSFFNLLRKIHFFVWNRCLKKGANQKEVIDKNDVSIKSTKLTHGNPQTDQNSLRVFIL
jgi:hypothetical protein